MAAKGQLRTTNGRGRLSDSVLDTESLLRTYLT
jgi:hypothetical protein